MKWLQEEEKPKRVSSEQRFVRFTKGKGNNKDTVQLYLSKSLFEEAEQKGFQYIRLGVSEKDGKKMLGFNLNKGYGGIELKNKNGGWRKIFNVKGFLKAYENEGIELPLNTRLELTKEGQNYIHYLD